MNKLKIFVSILTVFLLILIIRLSLNQTKYSFSGLVIGDSYDNNITGQVVVPNVRVTAINQDTFKVTRMSYVTHSDTKGSFKFKNLLSGHYQIMFSSDGSAPASYYNFDEIPSTFVTLNRNYIQKQPLLLTLRLNNKVITDLHKESTIAVLIKALDGYKKVNGFYPSSNSNNYIKLMNDSVILDKLSKYLPNGKGIFFDSLPIEYLSNETSYFLKAANINFPDRHSVYLSAYPDQGIVYYFTDNIYN